MGILGEAKADEPKSEATKDLLVTYRAMVDAMREGNRLILAGQKEKFDTTRYHKLEIKVNALWPKLSKTEQRIACTDLVKTGHMPQGFMDALVCLNGTINMEEPPEPCLKL